MTATDTERPARPATTKSLAAVISSRQRGGWVVTTDERIWVSRREAVDEALARLAHKHTMRAHNVRMLEQALWPKPKPKPKPKPTVKRSGWTEERRRAVRDELFQARIAALAKQNRKGFVATKIVHGDEVMAEVEADLLGL